MCLIFLPENAGGFFEVTSPCECVSNTTVGVCVCLCLCICGCVCGCVFVVMFVFVCSF